MNIVPITNPSSNADLMKDDHLEFSSWFQGSKATRPDGSPLILFHGTNLEFEQFEPSEHGLFGRGIYLTSSYIDALQYTDDEPLELYAAIVSPFVTKADYDLGERFDVDAPSIPLLQSLFPNEFNRRLDQLLWDDPQLSIDIMNELRERGHDGIRVDWPKDPQFRRPPRTEWAPLIRRHLKSQSDHFLSLLEKRGKQSTTLVREALLAAGAHPFDLLTKPDVHWVAFSGEQIRRVAATPSPHAAAKPKRTIAKKSSIAQP